MVSAPHIFPISLLDIYFHYSAKSYLDYSKIFIVDNYSAKHS